MTELFLGRTEEQERFRQALRSLQPGWLQRHLPTLTKPFAKPPEDERNLPFLLLFHGEGGMGKTTLIQRLHQIVEQDKEFRDQCQLLFLDWERERDRPASKLKVGHDYIQPETVLQLLYKALVNAGWGSFFEAYRRQGKEIERVEQKVEKMVRSRPNPDLPAAVTSGGAAGIAWLVRKAGLEVSSTEVEKTLKVSAEALHQAREFVQKALTPKEFATYAQPQERLAEALGQGLATLARRQPVVLLLDTFEIVDRPECDYTLRTAIRCSGPRIVWAIAGRANLADSGRRGNAYFRGYKADFPDNRLYATALSEFSVEDIQTYFQQIVPDHPITAAQAAELARFSLGIPFVLREAAAMWREGAAMAAIVAPVKIELGQIAAHQQVINQTSERFLVHCFSAKEKEQDLQAIYALAMLHRPDVALLKAMLDCEDLEERLQSLRQRYSFIWVERVRLAEKLAHFLREYLLADLRRTDAGVQQLAERAIAWLELELEARARPLTDTADRFEDERIADAMLALVYYQCWHDEDAGWRALLPCFVEGWQYDRGWTRSLLEVVELFKPYWSQSGRRRFDWLVQALPKSADPDATRHLLAELDKPIPRQWLDGSDAAERRTILRFKKGDWLYEMEKYDEALSVYLDVKNQLADTTQRLKTDLAEALYRLSEKFIWPKGKQYSIYSCEGEQAIETAVVLNAAPTWSYYYNLGVVKDDAGQYEKASAAYQCAIALDPNHAYPHSGLGEVYRHQGKYEEAIDSYRRSIALDPNFADPHNGLGNAYCNQGKYEEAIASYQRAIALDPNDIHLYYNLGNAYCDQGKYEEAIASYQRAIALDPNDADPHNNLGIAYSAQGQYEEAIASFQHAIALDPNDTYPHANLGIFYLYQNQLDQAESALQESVHLAEKEYGKPNYDDLFWLGSAKALQGQQDEAIALWQKSLTLCNGTTIHDQLNRLLIEVALAAETLTPDKIQQPIAQAQAAKGLLQETLEFAELLARCPTKPAQVEELIGQLKAALKGTTSKG